MVQVDVIAEKGKLLGQKKCILILSLNNIVILVAQVLSINQSINQSIKQSNNQTIDQSINQFFNITFQTEMSGGGLQPDLLCQP